MVEPYPNADRKVSSSNLETSHVLDRNGPFIAMVHEMEVEL